MKKNRTDEQPIVEMEGLVTQNLSNGLFRVKLTNGFVVLAHLSGRIRRHHIRILIGDRVVVLLSPYDLRRGRIVYRLPHQKRGAVERVDTPDQTSDQYNKTS